MLFDIFNKNVEVVSSGKNPSYNLNFIMTL